MKNKSNRLFHMGLFAESLRQVRMMGLVYLLLCLIFAILPPLLGAGSTFYPASIDEHAIVLYFYDFIAPVTMGYVAFGYLTRRNASDFYHSLPVTREAAYFSRTAAISVYILLTIVLTAIASFCSYAFAGTAVSWVQLPLLVTYHFACAMLVLTCTLVGISAAGTYFSSFVVAGLALFLPQLILFVLYLLIENNAPTVYPETLSFLLDISLNIPAGLIASIFIGGFGLIDDFGAYMLYFPAHLYTLALAVIALLVGCVIHNRRRSEIARSAAPNPFLQHLYRCLISLPLFLIIGTLIANGESWYTDSESYIILIVVGLIVYFLYELITMRKWRSLIGALKVLPIVLIVALVLPWLGFGIGHAVNDNVPARSKIESVTLDAERRYDLNINYELIGLSRYEYTNEAMLDVLHEALEMTVDYYERNGSYIGAVVSTTPIEEQYANDVYSNVGYRTMDVQYNLKNGKSEMRRIRLTPEQYSKVIELRNQDEGFRAIIADLPTVDQVTGLRIAGHMLSREAVDFSEVTLDRVWNTFCEEYAMLSTQEQMMLSNYSEQAYYVEYSSEMPVALENTSAAYIAKNEFGLSYYDTGNNLQVVGFDGLRTFNNNYKITSLTPKTLLLMMRYINDVAALQEDMLGRIETSIREMEEQDSINFYMTLRIYDPENLQGGVIDLSRSILSAEQMLDPEMAEEIARDAAYSKYPNYVGYEYLDTILAVTDLLSRGSTDIRDLNSPIVLMENVSWDSYKTYMGYSTSPVFFRLSEQDFAQLMAIVGEYQSE